jgi:pyruvate-formate lyase-activating enzyme
VNAIAIMLTRRCNMACAHCSVESGPKAGGKGPTLEKLLASVREAAAAGVKAVNVTGGEPMLRERTTLAVVRECCRLGIAPRLTTNGFWGRNPERAHRTLGALLDAGVGGLTVSYDRFHAAFQGPEPVIHIARAAADRDFTIDVNVTRLADDSEIEALIAPFADLPSVRLRFYDVQPVGAARHLPGIEMRSEVEGFCSACGIPALTDDGRLTACNGPSYFSPAGSPLLVGSLEEAPLGELLARHRNDPILDTIRTEGPGGLRDVLRTIPGFESFPFRDRYSGMCDLCHQLTSSPEAVAALRVSLATPERAARRAARTLIIDDERSTGALSRYHVNTVGAARTFLDLAVGGASDAAVGGRVIGRADLDWRAQAEALIAAGLARPLLGRLEEPALSRWAPALFGSMIRRAAVVDEARELGQRAALAALASALRDAGAEGIVMGGAALWPWERADAGRGRAVRAVEVVVSDRNAAAAVRARIQGGPGRGPIGIRSRVAPEPWGLPDAEILRKARPIPDRELAGLRRIAPADALVCAMVDASARGLRGGLEAAWDALVALRSEPVDAERIAALVAGLSTPRAFWIPARVLARRVGIAIPEEVLARAPDDARQRRLEKVAERRLFRVGAGSPVAEWAFRWAWPALAGDTESDLRRRIPRAAFQAARELPSAWREIGASKGVAGAVREARRVHKVWTSASKAR